VLEVRLGIQRGWAAGEFPILWFAAGFLDFYRGFHWPETHYVRYDRVEFLDYIDTNPGTVAYYEWINTTGYDVIFDSIYTSIKNNDTTARYPVMDIYSNGKMVGRAIAPGSIASGSTYDVSWVRGFPYTLNVSTATTVKFPWDREFKAYEGFRIYLYQQAANPTFNVVRAVFRKIVR
jgi:hypothetical protein